MAVTTDMVDTPMPMVDTVISARGLLMPNPRLMPLLMLTTDTTAVDTDTDMVSVMAVTTDMVDTPMPMVDTVISARGPLMPNLRLMPLLMLTTDTTAVDMDTDMVSVMAVDTTDMVDTPM